MKTKPLNEIYHRQERCKVCGVIYCPACGILHFCKPVIRDVNPKIVHLPPLEFELT